MKVPTVLILGLLYLLFVVSADDVANRKLEFTKQRIQQWENNQGRVIYSTATGAAHLVVESKETIQKRNIYGSTDESLAAFLASHPELGINDAKNELIETQRLNDAHIAGWFTIFYQQVYQGLIVESAMLKAKFNAENQVVSTTGSIVPNLKLSVVPSITGPDAIRLSRSVLPTDMTFDIGNAELKIYRTNLAQGTSGSNHLAYHVTFSCDQHHQIHYVFIDAHTGDILNQFNPTHHAVSRTVTLFGSNSVLFTEGGSTPTNSEVLNLVNTAGKQYDIMKNTAGWSGWDLNDGPFLMTVNVTSNAFQGWTCPNAAFVGDRTIYCFGLGRAIDVTAHEWGHAYSSAVVGQGGLNYQYQSGALNEAFADIIGESVQLLWNQPQAFSVRPDRSCTLPANNRRWIVGDQVTDFISQPNVDNQIYGIRDMYNPNCYENPAAAANDPYIWCNDLDNGGVHINSGIPNQAFALFVDGGSFNSQTFTGVGLVKAFHVYMRSLDKHTPASTFSQHADYVTQACTELATNAIDLADPLTGTSTGITVTNTDCDTLAGILSATAMRTSNFCGVAGELPAGRVLNGPFPPVILDLGLDFLYWETANFLAHQNVQCKVNSGTAYAGGVYKTQWSEFSYCQAPAAPGYNSLSFSISYNGTTFEGPYDVTVIPAYEVTSHNPTTGTEGGGTTVTFLGAGFTDQFTGCNPGASSESDPDCQTCLWGQDFNGVSTRAVVASSSSLSCESPPWQSLGLSNFSAQIYVSMNYFLVYGPLPFEYTADPNTPSTIPSSATPSNSPSVTATPTRITPVAAPKTFVVSSQPKVVLPAALIGLCLIGALFA